VLKEEKGSALIYVLLISSIIMIIVPIVYSMIINTSSTISRSVYEKKVNNLAVSGMQAYMSNKELLQNESLYGKSIVTLPNDTTLSYFQFAVMQTDPADISHMLDYDAFISTHNNDQAYSVVIACIVGDTNNNNLKDSDERNFFQKKLVYNVTAVLKTAPPTIEPSPLSGETIISGRAEAGSAITIHLPSGDVYTGTANINPSSNLAYYSISVPILSKGVTVTVTAKAPGKTVSNPITAMVEETQQTEIPTITPLPIAGNTFIRGKAEQNATIIITLPGGLTYTGIANINPGTGKANYSITVRALNLGEIIYVTAQAPRKIISNRASVKVYPSTSNPNDDGLVIITTPDGTVTYQEIDNIIVSPYDSITVTSSVGTFTSNENINFTGTEITVQPGVKLITNDNQGNIVGLNLHATKGSVNIQNITLVDNAQKSFSKISIKSDYGAINLTGSNLTAENDIQLTAATNIYANNSIVKSLGNSPGDTISFYLNPGGMIYVNGAYFNKNVTTNVSNNRICGTLAQNSSTINGLRSFQRCPSY
jgi:hypothetical protein